MAYTNRKFLFISAALLFIIIIFSVTNQHGFNELEIHLYPGPNNNGSVLPSDKETIGFGDCRKVQFSAMKLPRTYLASFPGSGNTWVRHLLQQATGKKAFSFVHYFSSI